ncbi:MAG: M20 family metallopeptidase [Fusobacteriaceae bacterium]|jgi:amidohydrolase|nr:M20 family metallopeptidase [Fusobacteriaceae bacterium]
MKEKLTELFDAYLGDFQKLNEYLYENPELGNREFKAAAAHQGLLEKYGFTVEGNFCGLPTAFKAVWTAGKPGPRIAFLAEYDALPAIGHGCGHNILGVASDAAAILCKEALGNDFPGEIWLVGTPAEETDGAKVHMAKKGAFDGLDAAMIAHPDSEAHYKTGTSAAMEAIRFTFRGKTAHAAAAPWEGINALDAVITMFNAVNALRQETPTAARIHGVISEGGKAANIIPDLAVADFYVRAPKLSVLNPLVEKVKNCARGAALATGATLSMENYEASFADLMTNGTLSDVYEKNLRELGVTDIRSKNFSGSTDVGDVSHRCPTIHPEFPLTTTHLTAHSVEMARATLTPEAYKGMKEAAVAMALTALDLIRDPQLLKAVRAEFEKARAEAGE